MMMRRIGWLLMILLVRYPANSFADHLPEHLLARGRPETILAGIDLKHTSFEKIVRLYGKPTEQKRWEPGLPNSSGAIDYYWRRRGLNLHVQVEFLPERPDWKSVGLAAVGRGTSRKVKTGVGLGIGDTLSDLRRVYGNRYHLRDIPKLNIHDAMFQWRQEEYSLVAELDHKNRITSLTLVTPE